MLSMNLNHGSYHKIRFYNAIHYNLLFKTFTLCRRILILSNIRFLYTDLQIRPIAFLSPFFSSLGPFSTFQCCVTLIYESLMGIQLSLVTSVVSSQKSSRIRIVTFSGVWGRFRAPLKQWRKRVSVYVLFVSSSSSFCIYSLALRSFTACEQVSVHDFGWISAQ